MTVQADDDFIPEGVSFSHFKIGMEFMTGSGRWRVTDIGTRTVIAIRIDQVEIGLLEGDAVTKTTLRGTEAEAQGWFGGPPYAVAEVVFDEYDFEGCSPVPE